MFCKECGAELVNGARFCKKCGHAVLNESKNDNVEQAEKKTRKKPKKSFVSILVALLVIIGAYYFFIYDHVSGDVKNIVFNEFGTATIGEAASDHLSNVKWNSQKIENKYYTVILKGFSPKLYSQIEVEFDVSYSEDNVYAKASSVSLNRETYYDEISIRYIMATIYGNNDITDAIEGLAMLGSLLD